MKNVLVTGASGYLGGRLARALCAEPGVEKVVGTDIRPPAFSSENFVFLERDIRLPLSPVAQEHAIDTLVHMAYVLPPLHDTAHMEDVNLNGARNVLLACTAPGVGHLLHLSSTTAYGFHPDNPPELTEDHPLRGNEDFTYAKNKREIEALVDAFAKAHPDKAVTVIRPCFVVGPGIDNPLSHHLEKRVSPLPEPSAPLQLVHEDDLTNALVLCLKERVAGTYNICGQGAVPFPEMVRRLGNRPVLMPFFLMRALTAVAWRLHLSGLTEIPAPALNQVRHRWVASPEKFIQKTGFTYQHDSARAFEDYVRSRVSGGKA